ncbi:MAG: acyltransferase family protein [Planctomycetota bacterium]|jgi:predicted acyltransferase
MDEIQTKSPEDKKQMKLVGRVMSIDALRGFDMFFIIGGERIFASLHDAFDSPTTELIRTQLTHVKWEGFRFEDLIMPLFLFIVGVVMPYSFEKRRLAGHGKTRLYLHILKRTVILFVLGMVAQGNLLEFDISKLHIYSNTLQAIAAGYIIAAIIMLNLGIRWQIAVTGILLLLFWALMILVPFPGRGADVLMPDSNLAIYIDRIVFGSFIDGTDPPYTWLLSSMTFACTVMLGVMAGHLLRTDKVGIRKVLWLLAIGAGCIVAGLAWSLFFPIIKHLWTSSFVLFSGGICFVLLALFYLVIDVLGFSKWAFGFVVIGMNAITVYMAVHLINFRLISGMLVGGLEKYTSNWYPLIHALAGFAIVWLILWWMYRKKTFIKI